MGASSIHTFRSLLIRSASKSQSLPGEYKSPCDMDKPWTSCESPRIFAKGWNAEPLIATWHLYSERNCDGVRALQSNDSWPLDGVTRNRMDGSCKSMRTAEIRSGLGVSVDAWHISIPTKIGFQAVILASATIWIASVVDGASLGSAANKCTVDATRTNSVPIKFLADGFLLRMDISPIKKTCFDNIRLFLT